METNGNRSVRIRRLVISALVGSGLLLFTISLGAEYLGLDLTPGFGLVQMVELLMGLSSLLLAAFLYIKGMRQEAPRSLQADIGVRLAATGLVFAYVTGLSDVLRIGTHVAPAFERPFVGPLQLGGLLLALAVMVAGTLLYYTSRGRGRKSSMEFILNGNGKGHD